MERSLILEKLQARYARLCVELREQIHAEAYCLMRYRDVVTGAIEVLWNSRNGVTPFIIGSRQGNEARHVDFNLDACRPHHVPNFGDRIFVDATPEWLLEQRERMVTERWDDLEYPISATFESKDEAIFTLAMGDYDPGIPPRLIEVTTELARARGWDPNKRPQRLRHG